MSTIHGYLNGKVLFVTGATGFLAKSFVEKVLRRVPDVQRMYLLIRPGRQSSGEPLSPEQRLRRDVYNSNIFCNLRKHHGDGFEAFLREKIVAVSGDLTQERLGIDSEMYEQLTREVDIVVNSAATVVFDERIDISLELNTLGPRRILEFAKDCSNAVFLHVSTAYVNGKRTGRVDEAIMEPNRTIAQITGNGSQEPFDLDAEIASILKLRDEVEAEAVSERTTRRFVQMLDRQDHGKRVTEVRREAQLRALRERWTRERLVRAGLKRARELGWQDNYTYTKALGEQLLARDRGDVPMAIVRPSIIESSLREPEPGWLDGLKVADPIIAHYSKGRLKDFPGNPRTIMDIIPVDMVVNAMFAALPPLGNGAGIQVYHVATSSENPVTLGSIVQLTYLHFRRYPMKDRAGKPIPVGKWKFPTEAQFRRLIKYRYKLPLGVLQWALEHVPLPWPSGLRRKVSKLNLQMERVLSLVDIYSPYTYLNCEFGTENTRRLYESLSDEDRKAFNFDVSVVDWREYVQDIHLPGLKRHVLKVQGETPSNGGGEE